DSRLPPALAAPPKGGVAGIGWSAWLTTGPLATTAGAMGGSPVDPRRVLAHAVLPLSGRDRAGETARAPGARPRRGSPHRAGCAAAAGPGGGAQPAVAIRPGAAPAAAGPPLAAA